MRPHDPRWTLAVAILGSSIAFLDGTVVGVALPVMQRVGGSNGTERETATESARTDLVAAATLRRQAYQACDDRRWSDCVALLDDAKRVDPVGESAADVQAAREKAARGQEEKKPKLK